MFVLSSTELSPRARFADATGDVRDRLELVIS